MITKIIIIKITECFIYISNDNYDRYSSLCHRPNFEYRGDDSKLHNFDDLNNFSSAWNGIWFEFRSKINDHNHLRRSIGLVDNLIIKVKKQKIKLEKIKMNKNSFTKNEGDKIEVI